MTKQTLTINNLDCLCVKNGASARIAYILYPMEFLANWIEEAALRYDTTIVVITGMDWQNDLTPWPAKGVPPGTPDFEGNAPAFLKTIIDAASAIESRLNIPAGVARSLVGASLSGLFTLWQWPQTDFFLNIASLSGSFWYEGFTEWFATQNLTAKTGFAYFLLGDKEPYSNVKTFNSVGINTRAIVTQLKAEGVSVQYDTVPGNHFQFPLDRLNCAMLALSRQTPQHPATNPPLPSQKLFVTLHSNGNQR